MQDPGEINKIKNQIAELESQVADLEARLPAHSIPPSLISEIDLLDDEIQSKKKMLAELLDKHE